ncbi:rhodanese-like domain-containing protein [Streptomyces sp. NPDC002164]|uniref:rhodanese-like domain-containing protein n=1 Tax=unclassified Streptomyces TaxID=2593676 RepID=UPI00369DB185
MKVLPHEEYEGMHLPGAVHLCLRKLDHETAQRLDRTRAVVVYCWDWHVRHKSPGCGPA